MNTRSHTYNSTVNSLVGIFTNIVTILINFAIRIVIVNQLGEEINGLYNLFTSIAGVITIIEIGLSSAIIIHLYKPMKENDIEKIKAILRFYRNVYIVIALVFAAIAAVIDLFVLEHIITTTLSMTAVKVYFLIFSLSYCANYLTYYKRSILFAEQKNRISSLSTSICEIVFRGVQILIVYLTHNYYLFLAFFIVEKVVSNLLCTFYVNKHHPYLRGPNHSRITKEDRSAIFKTVRPLMVSSTASTVETTSKSIIISALLGNISIVGFFGNYNLVINSVQALFSQFGAAFTTSFGNLSVDANIDGLQRAYYKTRFVLNWIALVLSTGFIFCIQYFINMFFGPDFVLSLGSAVILTLTMYVSLFNVPIVSIQNAMGLHRKDVYFMIAQALISIGLSILLGYFFGMIGILLGSLVPLFIFSTIVKGIIICQTALGISPWRYLLFMLKEFIKVGICVGLGVVAIKFVPISSNVAKFFIFGVAAIFISVLVGLAFEIKNPVLKDLLLMIKNLKGHKKQKNVEQ